MNDNLVVALTQLFAYVVMSVKLKIQEGRSAFIVFLETKDYREEDIETIVHTYDDYLEELTNLGSQGQTDLLEDNVRKFIDDINLEFEAHQKMWLLLQLCEFTKPMIDGDISKLTSSLKFLSEGLRVNRDDLEQGMKFIIGEEAEIPKTENLLLVSSQNTLQCECCKYLQHNKLMGRVYVLRLESTNMYLLKYYGTEDGNLFLNGRGIHQNTPYLFGLGTVIRGALIDPIYYNKVVNIFSYDGEISQLEYIATNISYRFLGSREGVAPFDFHAKTGELVGIVGGSGVGKSTLLNLLNGSLKFRKGGQITINGLDLQKNREQLKGIIGYVPQDDLLTEELTVVDNLRYNAQLCFKGYSKQQIEKLVEETIQKFDLVEAKNLRVGNPLNKFISGGQRKRLNIAMEFMRNPYILFIDEPTSGLSSIDSEKIMFMLKRQSMAGRLIIVNIHQPSSDIFKLFNRILVVDHGGKVIFQGNPMDAIRYFKIEAELANISEDECSRCGTINTDIILKVVESRLVNEYGTLTRIRKRSARQWYKLYKKNVDPLIYKKPSIFSPLPPNNFQVPSRFRQFIILLQRTIKSKFADTQYLLVTIFIVPILALILGYFTKFVEGVSGDPTKYIYSENSNIPAYFLMSVVAILFCGLSSSAEQIVKDRKVRQREKFLNLSRNAYLFSKLVFLMGVSALQTLAFVWIGNTILEIQTEIWTYWIILFSSAVCANIIGLNLSAALQSEVAIYMLIPFLLVPQILLSGMVVPYDSLHPSISALKKVPTVGNIAVSRWALEAIAVSQYRDNAYEKTLFYDNMKISQYAYWTAYLLPILENRISELQNISDTTADYTTRWKLITNSFISLANSSYLKENTTASYIAGQMKGQYDILHLKEKLSFLREDLMKQAQDLREKRNQKVIALSKKLGGYDALQNLKEKNVNQALSDLVRAKMSIDKMKESKNMIIQCKDPIYTEPIYKDGTAHFYAPYKRIGSWKISTVFFNTMVLWCFSFIGYILLYFNVAYKMVSWINTIKIMRIARRFAKITPV